MKRVIVLLTAALLAACSSTGTPESYPTPTFNHLPFTQIEAADLQVRNDYVAPRTAPNVEHVSPVSYFDAIDGWAIHRLRPMGTGRDTLVVNIVEASITEKALPVDSGLSGAFKREQAVEYEATVEVTVQMIKGDGSAGPDLSARVWASQTAEEGLSDYGRHLIWLDLIRDTITELDRRVEEGLRESFSAQLIR